MRTLVYHPRKNDAIERDDGMPGKMLAKCVENHVENWDLFIKQSLFVCRVRQHCSTGMSPFFMVYGKLPKIPGDFLYQLFEIREDTIAAKEKKIQQLENLGLRREVIEKMIQKRNVWFERRALCSISWRDCTYETSFNT